MAKSREKSKRKLDPPDPPPAAKTPAQSGTGAPRAVRIESASEPETVDRFQRLTDDQGLSLDDLSSAFANLLQQGDIPYEADPSDASNATGELIAGDERGDAATLAGDDLSLADLGDPAAVEERNSDERLSEDDGACELSPRTILEALLFVGHPENRPLSAAEVAGLMRGVRPEEIDDLVRELNDGYANSGAVYRVTSSGPGYRLELRPAYAGVRDRMLGRMREARLSQAAIDVLAVVAYNQPLTRDQIDHLRGKPSLSLLNQLVRRQLLRVEDVPDRPRQPNYHTTDRFLALFGLESLSDLPQSQNP